VALVVKKDNFLALNIRRVPEVLFYKIKMAAAVERKSTRDLVLDLLQGKIDELERQGKLPKEK
jgi:ERCC4-type nuclease